MPQTNIATPLTVLVATESRADADAIRDILGTRCNVVWTENGTRTLAAIRDATPDLVIFDTSFADVDCRALSARLAATPSTESTSLIALVWRDDPNAEARAIADGASDTVFKPIDPPVLGARVGARLALRSNRGASVESAKRDDVGLLPDRDAAEQMLEAEWRRSARDQRSLAALLVEIDDLDVLAQSRGPAEAEVCARNVGRCIRRACLRGGDVVVRSADAQFVVLLPRADESGARAVAERVRRGVVESSIPNPSSSVAETATVSVGVASVRPLPTERSMSLLELAALRLDRARREGKNRAVGDTLDAVMPPAPPRTRLSGTILVVDDTPPTADVLTGLLSTTGSDVRVALNGRDALAAVRTERPDLILLGVRLSDIDGYEVCRRLKADSATAAIPVILIRGAGEPLDKSRAFEVGAADCIEPPFHAAEVLARIAAPLEIARLQADVRAANARLLELDALKATITAMLAQDLRSPLTVVQMVLASMSAEAESNPAAIPNLAHTASAGVAEIIRLVSDMLDVYRGEVAGKSFSLHPMNPAAAITRAFEFARVAARSGGVRLDLDVEPNLPFVMGNEERLERALTGLISNAIRYTPTGGTITLSASTRAGVSDGRRPRLRIDVADTGPGFAPDESAKRLASVKHIVDAHRGTLAVDGDAGRGTRVTIEIETVSSPS